MNINIETTKKRIFEQYLRLINPMLGQNKLSNMEIEMLSRILLIDFMYKDLPQTDRDLLIFHTKTRNQILLDISEDHPGFSKAVFHNVIASLKKKGIISGEKRDLKLDFANPLIELKAKDPKATTLKITINLHGQDLE